MSIKNKLAAVACGLALVGTVAAPVAALADTTTNGTTGSTRVEVVATDAGNQITFSVPTVIPFHASADGTLEGPSADSTKITNLSVFPIHVTNMAVAAEHDWNLVPDANQSSADNSLSFNVHGVTAAASTDLASDINWNMSHKDDGAKASIALATSGAVSHVKKDISTSTKIATITWTLAAGNATTQN